MTNQNSNKSTKGATPFQVHAMRRVTDVLEKHGIPFDGFCRNQPSKTFSASFAFAGRGYTIAVFEDDLNMMEGPNLYECSLREEFRDENTQIAGFIRRLELFLDGNLWD